MKTFLLSSVVLALFLFAIGAFAQEKTDLEKLNLQGAVKRVETYYLVTSPDDGKEAVQKQISEAISFNRRGQTTEWLSYSSGDLPVRSVYIYNKTGRRVLNDIMVAFTAMK